MKVRVPKKAGFARFVLGPAGRMLLAGFALCVILGLGAYTYYYQKYSKLIDEKLRSGPFANTAKIYAAPETVAVGDRTTPAAIATDLRRSGYTESPSNPIGYYRMR